MKKVVASADEAIRDIPDGATIMVGGFGLCGIPENLIAALVRKGVKNLTTISNNVGVDDFGLGKCLYAGQIKAHIGSYVGENKKLEEMVLSNQIDLTLVPQGTFAERLRAGGAGIPAFYTPGGVGTQVADGGLPRRYNADGTVAVASEPKEVRVFDGRQYVLEEAIVTDFALVHAKYGDRHGNLVYEKSAQNFNPLCAAAGRITVASVEELVEPGKLDPMHVHTPGVFVQRVVQVDQEKRIERRTVRA